MIVVKFGGTSLAGTERLRAAAAIVAAQRNEQPVVCVVSAMSGVTDTLLHIADLMMKKSESQAQNLLTVLIAQHEQVTRGLTTRPSLVTTTAAVSETITSLTAGFAAMRADLEGLVALREHPDDDITQHTIAAFSGWGERLAVLLFALALAEADIAAIPFAGEPVMLVNEPADESASKGVLPRSLPAQAEDMLAPSPLRRGSRGPQALRRAFMCRPIPSVAATRTLLAPQLMPQLAAGSVPVLPGYLARTEDGLVTTLGRNGSDYSAALIAAALGADCLVIYSDVAGVHRADPRAVPEAALLSVLTYADAAEMSALGARVLHPETLRPLAAAGIPLHLRSSFAPNAPGTIIGAPATLLSPQGERFALERPAWVVIARTTSANRQLFGGPGVPPDGLVEVTGLFLRHADLPASEDDHLCAQFGLPGAENDDDSDDSDYGNSPLSGYLDADYPDEGAVSGALALLSAPPRPIRLALAARSISVAVPAAESVATQRRLYHALLHADERAMSQLSQRQDTADEPMVPREERRRSS